MVVTVKPQALISSVDGDECSASRSSRLIPVERDLSTHWLVEWFGFRTGTLGISKILVHLLVYAVFPLMQIEQ